MLKNHYLGGDLLWIMGECDGLKVEMVVIR